MAARKKYRRRNTLKHCKIKIHRNQRRGHLRVISGSGEVDTAKRVQGTAERVAKLLAKMLAKMLAEFRPKFSAKNFSGKTFCNEEIAAARWARS